MRGSFQAVTLEPLKCPTAVPLRAYEPLTIATEVTRPCVFLIRMINSPLPRIRWSKRLLSKQLSIFYSKCFQQSRLDQQNSSIIGKSGSVVKILIDKM